MPVYKYPVAGCNFCHLM